MDVIIGVVIIAMVAGTVAGALSTLMRQSTSVYSITRATWMGNSVMEIWSAKEFDDIEVAEDFTLDQYPGYSANVLVEPKDYDSDLSRLVSGNEDSQYKKIIVDKNNCG